MDRLRGERELVDRVKLHYLESVFAQLENSLVWQLYNRYLRLVDRLFPEGSRRRLCYDRLITWQQLHRRQLSGSKEKRPLYSSPLQVKTSRAYQVWQKKHEPSAQELQVQKQTHLAYAPKISIVLPCFNPDLEHLNAAVTSLLEQTYNNWELCVADSSSSAQGVAQLLEQYQDQRLKYLALNSNGGIAGNTNQAINIACGDYVAFMDQDDTLAAFALWEVVKRLNSDRRVELIYSDEDKIDQHGNRFCPMIKPEFSPTLLEGCGYIGHLMVCARQLGSKLGWLRSEFEGAQDYDFVLRATRQTTNIAHIPQILYHWRVSPGSSAYDPLAKAYIYVAALSALTAYAQADPLFEPPVELGKVLGHYRIRRKFNAAPGISVFIWGSDVADSDIAILLNALARQTVRQLDVTVWRDHEAAPGNLLSPGLANRSVRVLDYPRSTNVARSLNQAALEAKGEYCLFIALDHFRYPRRAPSDLPFSAHFVQALGEYAQLSAVGAVGPVLYRENGMPYSAGILLGGAAGRTIRLGQGDMTLVPQGHHALIDALECDGLDAGVLMLAKTKFCQSGGWPEEAALPEATLKLCQRLRALDYKIICTPFAQ